MSRWKPRAEITIKFSVDLDTVPGTFHDPKDWVWLVTKDFERQSHYNPSYEVVAIERK